MEGEQKKGNGVMLGTVAALIIAVAAYGFYTYTKKDQTVATITPTPTTSPTPSPSDVVKSYMFKDGDYSATGIYNSPAGKEQIGVKVSVKEDIITNASVQVTATNPASKNWQTVVSNNIKSLVVGKKLSEVVLDKVSGSSLTPKGWNDAIAKIQAQARV